MFTNWIGSKYNNDKLINYTELEHLKNVGISAELVEKRRYISKNHGDTINKFLVEYGINAKLVSRQMNWNEVKEYSEKFNSPIVIATMITSYGHIVLYVGDGLIHDPYGKCSEITNSYSGNGSGSVRTITDASTAGPDTANRLLTNSTQAPATRLQEAGVHTLFCQHILRWR
jgi:hypothetical protein